VIRGPVSLMKLVEVDEVEDALAYVPENKLWVEPKFNGLLISVINGRIYSRRGKELTGKFREIAGQAARYKSSYLLGELVYWGPDGTMDEPAVTHVAGTKDPGEAHRKLEEAPGAFQIALFDVLVDRGRDVTQEATQERRERLDGLIRPTWEVALSPVHPFRVWPELYKEATTLGGDGVVFKNVDSPYYWRPLGEHEARPMGVWFKLKPSSTDDFAVTGTRWGPKGRLIVELSQYHAGELVFVSEMSNIARDLESVFEKRARRGPFVIEVEFQSRFPDPPGALQHPRLVRTREDKGPEQTMLPERYVP